MSNNTCGVFDGNGILQFELPLKGVENNNHGFIVCKGEVPNDTGHAVHWDPNHNPTGGHSGAGPRSGPAPTSSS